MDNKNDEIVLIINALLHDIGKLLWKTGITDYIMKDFEEDEKKEYFGYAHPTQSVMFMKKCFPFYGDDAHNYMVIPALYHHKPENIDFKFLYERGITRECPPEERDKIKEITKIIKKADGLSASERDICEDNSSRREDLSKKRLLSPFNKKLEKSFPYKVLNSSNEEIYPKKEKDGSFELSPKDLKESFRKLENIPDWKFKINTLTSFLQIYTQFIPSASSYIQGKNKKIIPTISLFEHLKTTAAIALSLFRNKESEHKDKLTFIFGDLSGIQNFILEKFRSWSHPAKLIRGRSMFISLLSYIVIEFIKEELDLYDFNVLLNNGGNFMLMSQHVEKEEIVRIEREINLYLIKKFGLKLSYTIESIEIDGKKLEEKESSSKDVVNCVRKKGCFFKNVIEPLRKKISLRKNRKFKEYFKDVEELLSASGVISERESCPICGNWKREGEEFCRVCNDLILLGEETGRHSDFVLLTKESEETEKSINLFKGLFKGKSKYSGKLGFIHLEDSNSGDFEGSFLLTNNFDNSKLHALNVKSLEGEFKQLLIGNFMATNEKKIKTFEELNENGRLAFFKSDIDSLGEVLKEHSATISEYSFVSYLINLFYSKNLNSMCKDKNIYIVFSGGDDLSAVIDSNDVIEFTSELKGKFDDFFSKELTFSAGIFLFHYKFPMDKALEIAEDLLKEAKSFPKEKEKKEKDAIVFNKENLLIKSESISDVKKFYKESILKDNESNSLLYALLRLWDISNDKNEKIGNLIVLNPDPILYYLLKRNVHIDKKEKEGSIKGFIKKFKTKEFRIALEFHLLRNRGKKKGGKNE